MITIRWRDRNGDHSIQVDQVRTWEARGGSPEHPDGTVVEGYRDGIGGVLQLDATDRVGGVQIEVG